jgi:hypothetical protein
MQVSSNGATVFLVIRGYAIWGIISALITIALNSIILVGLGPLESLGRSKAQQAVRVVMA